MKADYTRTHEAAETSQKLKPANEELARLYEKTRELDELKSQFFASVSHELRTPLTLILGPVDALLRRAGLDEETQHGLLVLQRNAHLLHRHVDDLLDIARLEARRMLMPYAQMDSVQLVRLIGSYFDAVATDRHIHYEVKIPPALPAQVDGEKVECILINRFSNAFKFTPDNGATKAEDHVGPKLATGC
jgi:signal transduction histidine kinase